MMSVFRVCVFVFFFFFQAEDGIRDLTVTGVQTCALPIYLHTGLVCFTATARSLDPRQWRSKLCPRLCESWRRSRNLDVRTPFCESGRILVKHFASDIGPKLFQDRKSVV